jgi:hypothetical protein
MNDALHYSLYLFHRDVQHAVGTVEDAVNTSVEMVGLDARTTR